MYSTVLVHTFIFDGGAEEDRTRYLIVANDALSQMSYSPDRLRQP